MSRNLVVRKNMFRQMTSCLSKLNRSISSFVPNKKYLQVAGDDVIKFLQGLCSNDIRQIKVNSGGIAALFLNRQGRITADTIIYGLNDHIRNNNDNNDSSNDVVGTEPPRIIIETSDSAVDDLASLLLTHRLRSKVTIKAASLAAFTSTNNDCKDIDSLTVTTSIPDPRHPSFGTLHLVALDDASRSIIEVQTNDIQAQLSSDCVNILRALPLGALAKGSIPFEGNFDLLGYISFAKGCYIGQELMARTRYKGVVRKRIVPFALKSVVALANGDTQSRFLPCPDTLKSALVVNAIKNQADHKEISNSSKILSADMVGKQTGVEDKGAGEVLYFHQKLGIGLASMRLDALEMPLVIAGGDSGQDIVEIVTFRPDWWPTLDVNTGQPKKP